MGLSPRRPALETGDIPQQRQHNAARALPRALQGFTLVELLIVVVILAILAAIVVPSMSSSSDEARRARFAENLRAFVTTAQYAAAKNEDDIEDASSGVLPVELQPYIKALAWESGTPLGGVWDSEKSSFGVTSAIGVHFISGNAPDDAEMALADAIIDDGILTSGAFRKLADGRFYFVLVE